VAIFAESVPIITRMRRVVTTVQQFEFLDLNPKKSLKRLQIRISLFLDEFCLYCWTEWCWIFELFSLLDLQGLNWKS